jgi:hypothetical protein
MVVVRVLRQPTGAVLLARLIVAVVVVAATVQAQQAQAVQVLSTSDTEQHRDRIGNI